jgi:prepilin-type N-terminal cleavage/methylation domain-containing protein
MRKAFTLIEVIFVIVVLGIVSGMTFIQISFIYEEMVRREATDEIESSVKVVTEQISSRLSSAVKDSLVAMTTLDGTGSCDGVSTLPPANVNQEYILAWVGKSDEANLGLWDTVNNDDYKPGWSGFADIQASNTTNISTPGSILTNAEIIIDGLTEKINPYSLSQVANSPVALYFHESGSNTNACTEFGLNNAAPTKMYQVLKTNDTTLKFINQPTQISEQYTLSHSAYAVQRDGTDLYLYSFRPWLGEHLKDAKKFLIAKNISRFGFKWDNGMFRLNICASKDTNGFTAEVCKEKAIF